MAKLDPLEEMPELDEDAPEAALFNQQHQELPILLSASDVREEVRCELEYFAQESLRQELLNLAECVRQDFRTVVEECVGQQFAAFRLSFSSASNAAPGQTAPAAERHVTVTPMPATSGAAHAEPQTRPDRPTENSSASLAVEPLSKEKQDTASLPSGFGQAVVPRGEGANHTAMNGFGLSKQVKEELRVLIGESMSEFSAQMPPPRRDRGAMELFSRSNMGTYTAKKAIASYDANEKPAAKQANVKKGWAGRISQIVGAGGDDRKIASSGNGLGPGTGEENGSIAADPTGLPLEKLQISPSFKVGKPHRTAWGSVRSVDLPDSTAENVGQTAVISLLPNASPVCLADGEATEAKGSLNRNVSYSNGWTAIEEDDTTDHFACDEDFDTEVLNDVHDTKWSQIAELSSHRSSLSSDDIEHHMSSHEWMRENVFISKVCTTKDLQRSKTGVINLKDLNDSKFDRAQALAILAVSSIQFDIGSGLLVILNAIWIGIQTDYAAATNADVNPPGFYAIIDTCFCVVFTLELLLRICAEREQFLCSPAWNWNLFDLLLVALQLFEEVATRFSSDGDGSMPKNLIFMRILRILRVIRVVRLVRIVRMIGELRTIVTSIGSSLKSLGWTVVLLTLLMYVVGIYFTQLVSDHGRDNLTLENYYGSVARSVLSLFEAFTGGVDWDNLASPLITEIHPVCGVMFALYIAFAVLAMMNVVTGVFVETALMTARHDKDVDLINHLREVFGKGDADNSGTMTWEEFQECIYDPQMDFVFKAIDLDASEAKGLFELIDVGNHGEIGREEFIMGCLRLKGPAKALDLATLMYDTKRLANMVQEQADHHDNFMHLWERLHRHELRGRTTRKSIESQRQSQGRGSSKRASVEAEASRQSTGKPLSKVLSKQSS